jgi:uncharacterized protein (TIGR03382 family)
MPGPTLSSTAVTATQRISRLVLVGALLAAPSALAQDAGDGDGGVVDAFDASIPDASVGSGGADRDSPDEGDGRPVVFCKFNRDCDRGFNCVNGKCTWTGYRDATNGGCTGAPGAVGLLLAAVALRVRRRRSL